MAKYDLSKNLETSFTFSIDGKDFSFRKPTVREMRLVANKFSGIDKITEKDDQVKASDEAMAEIYKFISPIDHDYYISNVLEEQTIDVQNAFNEMIKAELGY